ncbi:MAG: hypothetical protein AAGJ53_09965 [Pseudomonadota bacterium]
MELLMQFLPLITGGAGGLVGGNILGALFRKGGMGVGSSSLIGIIGGALATQFLGPEMGNLVGAQIGPATAGQTDLTSILANFGAGAAGGGGLSIVFVIIRSLFGGRR